MENSRRNFIKKSAVGAAGITLGGLSARTYGNSLGANDKIRVGIVGFANRSRYSLIPAFLDNAADMNMEIVAVSDIWNKRREEAKRFFKEKGIDIALARNNEELYEKHNLDAVIIATADFQHALHCKQAVEAGCDVYTEKPFAETMDDNKAALKAVNDSGKIVQIGSQRRSGGNYHAAANYIQSGKFGDITMVEMTWNVNQPGRWRRPDLVAGLKEEDIDWKRYLMNRPFEPFDPRKYLEYRLFWPYSSGIPGQWMCHQIDTVHWFSGYKHPRNVVANGGIYKWKDGRRNYDTMTAVFEYGPANDKDKGFQVVYSSRQHNSAGGVKELYYSNGGTLNLKTNKVTPDGGLTQEKADEMDMDAFRLDEYDLASKDVEVKTAANTGTDDMTVNHMRNWMECLRSRKQPNAPVEAGYNHAIAVIMTNAAVRTKQFVTFDEDKQEVLAGGKPFKY